jgi:hypothetical protein
VGAIVVSLVVLLVFLQGRAADRTVERMRSLCLLGLGVWAALGLGCISPAQNRQDALFRIAHEYNDGLRWGRYDQVTPHLASGEAARFLARTGALGDDFEMADEEVAGIRFADAGMRADITVSFSWYNQRRSLLRQAVVSQDWRYTDGRWICVEQRRVRGDRLPLFPEPMAVATTPTR